MMLLAGPLLFLCINAHIRIIVNGPIIANGHMIVILFRPPLLKVAGIKALFRKSIFVRFLLTGPLTIGPLFCPTFLKLFC